MVQQSQSPSFSSTGAYVPKKKSHVSGTMASGSSRLPWDFFSSRLLDLSPGSFRPHLSGSLALPTMTTTGTVGPVGVVPTSRCSTGLPQSRGTSKGSRNLESPWPWPQSVQSVQSDQVFIAKSKNSRPSSQSLSLARANFWKTWRNWWSHVSRLGSLGGGGSNGSIACSENMFGGCWITGWWLKDAEGPRKINWIISNQTTMMWVQLNLWKTWFPTEPLAALGFQAVSLQGLRAKCIFKGWIFSLRPSVASGAVRRRDTLLNFIAIDWVNEMSEMSLFWGPNSKKKTDWHSDIIYPYIYIYPLVTISIIIYPYHWHLLSILFESVPWLQGVDGLKVAVHPGSILRSGPNGAFIKDTRWGLQWGSALQRYIPIPLILNIYP